MSTLWIVHRDPSHRDALARLAGAGELVRGAPSDPVFESAARPDAILLGLAGDLEAELEFAHRHAARFRTARWILLPEPGDEAEAARLFDTFPAETLRYPPSPPELRRRIRDALVRRRAEPLSARDVRDGLAARFGRLFADLEIPELLRALDPRLADVPVLIRGEAGLGRGLLARYLHRFGAVAPDAPFVAVSCVGAGSAAELAAWIRGAFRGAPDGGAAICLEDVDALPLHVQRELRAWIEVGPPASIVCGGSVRWLATADEEERSCLDPGLVQLLSGIGIRIPPLRRRPDAVAAFVSATTAAFCAARGEAPRRFAADALAALQAHPWPGNLRELEMVVVRTLAAEAVDPIRAIHLRFEELSSPVALLPAEVAALEGETAGEAPEPEAIAEAAVREGAPGRAPAAPAATELPAGIRRLSRALAHELRNPLVAIRSFAQLLPERFEDPEFRERLAPTMLKDVERLERLADRLAGLAELGAGRAEPVDVAALLLELLERERPEIHRRRLVVLEELDREHPAALGDPELLRFVFDGLVTRVLQLIPDRGDLYLASRHHPARDAGAASLRVLLRFRTPGRITAAEVEGVSVAENAPEFVLAEALLRAAGGSFAVDAKGPDEAVIVVDLPAPA